MGAPVPRDRAPRYGADGELPMHCQRHFGVANGADVAALVERLPCGVGTDHPQRLDNFDQGVLRDSSRA